MVGDSTGDRYVLGNDESPHVATTSAWSESATARCTRLIRDQGQWSIHEAAYIRQRIKQRPADQQVINELTAPPVDPGEALRLRDQRRQVPQPLPVAPVGPVESTGADLRAWRAEQDLGGRGLDFVVEVAGHDEGALLAVVVQQRRGVGAINGR